MMRPLRAVSQELSRSFDFSGRAARADYLWFLTASIALFIGCLILTLKLLSYARPAEVILVLVVTFYIPVTSAGVRRLHDVGHSGTAMLDPLKPTVIVLILTVLLVLFVWNTEFGAGLAVLGLLLWPLYLALAMLVIGAAVFMTSMFFSNTMGLLLLPSEPGPNKYGPNPNEVPQ